MNARLKSSLSSAALRLVLLALAATVGSGCAEVDPWQRGTLAKPHMALDPHPRISELRKHVQTSREAASGGSEATGGGCGCN